MESLKSKSTRYFDCVYLADGVLLAGRTQPEEENSVKRDAGQGILDIIRRPDPGKAWKWVSEWVSEWWFNEWVVGN